MKLKAKKLKQKGQLKKIKIKKKIDMKNKACEKL